MRLQTSEKQISCAGRTARPRTRFTLIELLVVIAILCILFSMLLPAFKRAMDVAHDAQCRSQLHQIGIAFHDITEDYKEMLPGGVYAPDVAGTEDGQRSWIGKEAMVATGMTVGGLGMSYLSYYHPNWTDHVGEIVPYLGGEKTAAKNYLCPALERGVFKSGVGSNGMFDYSMVNIFVGARVDTIGTTATLEFPPGSGKVNYPTPLVVEEDPAYHINSEWIDMLHFAINRMATTHMDYSTNYLAVDGSVPHIPFYWNPGPECQNWTVSKTNGHADINMGLWTSSPPFFGDWNTDY